MLGHALIALLAFRFGHLRPYFPPAPASPTPLFATLIDEARAPLALPSAPSEPDVSATQAVAPVQVASSPSQPSEVQAPAPAEAAPRAAATPSFQERYYRTGEVDQPAAPALEWRIDTSRLPPGERYRAALAVWVDAGGKITRIEIARVYPDGDEARDALRDLAQTEMEPALLAGSRVANLRVIEVVFSRSAR